MTVTAVVLLVVTNVVLQRRLRRARPHAAFPSLIRAIPREAERA